MKLSLICFTRAGAEVCKRLVKNLSKTGWDCEAWGPKEAGLVPLKTGLVEWAGEQFEGKDGLVFIGAAGIAGRAIAPFIKSKREDPAVVVVDDKGKYAISLLSGHLGGANELAAKAAKILGGQAVITTATDLQGKFAVDLFAKEKGLFISRTDRIKRVSAAVLKGETVVIASEFPLREALEGSLPEGVVMWTRGRADIWISVKEEPFKADLIEAIKLVPRALVLGIGCRKGISAEQIKACVTQVFKEQNLSLNALAAFSSIDLKKEEVGICEFAEGKALPFYTYPASLLEAVEGKFGSSEFVKNITGVDNVCERAALACARELGGGSLLVRKRKFEGVALAVAVLHLTL